MKTVTVSIDENVYRAARAAAAKHERSLKEMVRGYLRALASGHAAVVYPDWTVEEEKKNRQELVRLLSECKLELGYKPSREKTYEGGRFSRF